jgi:hypothetical protein
MSVDPHKQRDIPPIIYLKSKTNPRRFTRWKLTQHTTKPLYYRRGEYYHTIEQLESLAHSLNLDIVQANKKG